MRSLHHPAREDLTLPSIFRALSDPKRLLIFKHLAIHGPRACTDVGLHLSKPLLSHHFRVLRDAGLIHTSIEGRNHINSVRKEDLENQYPGLLAALLKALRREVKEYDHRRVPVRKR